MQKQKWLAPIIIIAVLTAGIGVGFYSTRPPAPPSENHENYTAYTQMLENIEAMTQEAHPSGSQQLAEVRAYLLAQLDGMGVEYQVFETLVTMEEIIEEDNKHQQVDQTNEGQKPHQDEENQSLASAEITIEQEGGDISQKAVFDEDGNITLYNILVKLDATDTEKGVLFVAHYDSEFDVPGACDDMTGVCSLLETIRRHANNKNLKNDMYFLFTDGEELGGMGARVFVRDNPEYKDEIELVINLDARGTSGGLLMFETSANDYKQVEFLRNTTSCPLSYSWLPMVYRMMSNGTDLTQFIEAGYSALNFAACEEAKNYGTPNDNISNLNRGTAYNFMQIAFEMSDYAAINIFKTTNNTQAGVYFTILPGVLILIDNIFAIVIAVIVMVSMIVLLIWQKRANRLGVVTAIIAMLLIVLTSASAVFLNAASYLLTIPLLCIELMMICPYKWRVVVASLMGFVLMLLYTPLCWFLAVLLGFAAVPFITLTAVIPALVLMAFSRLIMEYQKK